MRYKHTLDKCVLSNQRKHWLFIIKLGSLIGGRIYAGWYEGSYDSFDRGLTPPQFL